MIEHIGGRPNAPQNKQKKNRLYHYFVVGTTLACLILIVIGSINMYHEQQAKKQDRDKALKLCQSAHGQFVKFAEGGDHVCVAYPYRGDKP